jgi:hypothetical protein
MLRVTSVSTKPGYVLALAFDDGLTGEACIREQLFGPVFEPLKDPDYFAQVTVDRFGAVCWPNVADLVPDALYSELQQAGKKPQG